MDPYIGKKLGNYEIVELIGKGGMASVYMGHQPSMNRNVAVKIMAQQLSEDELFVKRFKNEAQLIAQLEHAHILPVYDFGEEGGTLYIVMRYLPAGTLDDRISEAGIPLDEAAAIFTQLASALDYAHQQDVIHRDLKPGNVMIDRQGNIFLTDFGIAKSLESGEKLTQTDSVVGTPTYMAPEQGLGESVDARSDIYSLGVILFEMLTGVVPFKADNPMAVMLKHINDAAPNPSSIKPTIHQAVSAVVLKALAKDPDSRFQTAGEMADALEKAVDVAKGRTVASASAGVLADAAATSPATPIADGVGATMPSPIAARPADVTSEAAAPSDGVAVPLAPTVPLVKAADEVDVALNKLSSWVLEREFIGTWLQALGVSLATFFALLRLTEGGLPEIALLSLLPGLLVYGLLRAPTFGALIGMVLIAVPLVAYAPGLALIWLVVAIIAGARLNSREIMLTLVTVVAAGTPFGWLVPLLAPWWLRARRVVLPAALGVGFATLFAATLGPMGWGNAGGLLSAPPETVVQDNFDRVTIGGFDTSYLGLFDEGVWGGWPDAVIGNIRETFDVLGDFFIDSNGWPLFVAIAWALAATLTVSNRRVQSPYLRIMGMGLALLVLLAAHLLIRPSSLVSPGMVAVVLGVVSALIAFGLSQWPLQADPNAGNRSGTVLRLLRQTLGALYMALGVAFFARFLSDSSLLSVLWIGGTFGVMMMIVNPLLGPPLVFASLVVALAVVRPALTVVVTLLLFAYMIINLIFDKRRPRRWNPLGAGIIFGAPGMTQAGILVLGPISIGALEAQVPAALMAVLGHVLLVATVAEAANPLSVIIQIVITIMGVLMIERLMGIGLLEQLHHKWRRLIFTVAAAFLMALGYYGLGRIAPELGLVNALLISVITAAALVAAMGDRAMYWRRFIEREEEEEEILEDDEVTGEVTTSKRSK